MGKCSMAWRLYIVDRTERLIECFCEGEFSTVYEFILWCVYISTYI